MSHKYFNEKGELLFETREDHPVVAALKEHEMEIQEPVEQNLTFKDAGEQVLFVSADGVFTWHPDAERLIEESDFSQSPALPHILRRLWAVEAESRGRKV
jgi:hypothetical protein